MQVFAAQMRIISVHRAQISVNMIHDVPTLRQIANTQYLTWTHFLSAKADPYEGCSTFARIFIFLSMLENIRMLLKGKNVSTHIRSFIC